MGGAVGGAVGGAGAARARSWVTALEYALELAEHAAEARGGHVTGLMCDVLLFKTGNRAAMDVAMLEALGERACRCATRIHAICCGEGSFGVRQLKALLMPCGGTLHLERCERGFISDICGKRGATYGEKGACRRIQERCGSDERRGEGSGEGGVSPKLASYLRELVRRSHRQHRGTEGRLHLYLSAGLEPRQALPPPNPP